MHAPLPPPAFLARPRIHVAVPFECGAVPLLVAAATLHVLEMQDAAQVAEDEGDEFDPSTDAVTGIFGAYGLVRRRDDAACPYWLCGTPHHEFSEEDVGRAAKRMGHFGKRVEVIYTVEEPVLSTENLNTADLATYADELGLRLPPDARARIRALVRKHAPNPAGANDPRLALQRLERAARAFRLSYGSPSKRARLAPPPRERSMVV